MSRLVDAGKSTEATTLAMQLYGDGTGRQSAAIMESMSPLSLMWIDVKNGLLMPHMALAWICWPWPGS